MSVMHEHMVFSNKLRVHDKSYTLMHEFLKMPLISDSVTGVLYLMDNYKWQNKAPILSMYLKSSLREPFTIPFTIGNETALLKCTEYGNYSFARPVVLLPISFFILYYN